MTLEAQLVSCPECGDDRLRLVEGVLECRACGAEVVGAGLVGAPASSEPPVGRVSFLDEAPSNLRVRQNDRAASAKWRDTMSTNPSSMNRPPDAASRYLAMPWCRRSRSFLVSRA